MADVKHEGNLNKQTQRDIEEKCWKAHKLTNALEKDNKDEDIELVTFMCLFLQELTSKRPASITAVSEFAKENEGYSTDCVSSSSMSDEHSEEEVESCETYQSDNDPTQEELWGSSTDLLNDLMSSRRPHIPDHLRFKNALKSFRQSQSEGQATNTKNARARSHWLP
jgi:hypothetical protein